MISWEQAAELDEYLGGGLGEACELLAKDHTAKLFEFFRETLAGRAGEAHEKRHGLLTPEAIADQGRREAEGRLAAQRDAIARANAPSMTINGQDPNTPSQQRAGPGCVRGVHRFGSLRGAHGEAECLDCQVVFVAPP